MGFYLQMDGVDDALKASVFQYNEIVIDMSINNTNPWRMYLDASQAGIPSGAILLDGSGKDVIQAGWASVYVNGELKVSGTAFVPRNSTRILLRAVSATPSNPAATHGPYIFANQLGQSWMKGNLYSVKFYLAGVLQCHYDMSLGNVQDQSGNGRHATLNGGTWVSDGPAVVDFTATFSTRQVITATRQSSVATKQEITAQRSHEAPTLQQIVANRTAPFATRQSLTATRASPISTLQQITARRSMTASTKQVITVIRKCQYSTLQIITSGFVLFTASYPIRIEIIAIKLARVATRQQITAQRELRHSLRQIITVVREWPYPIQIVIEDQLGRPEIITVVPILGQRLLTVPISGKRLLTVLIKGRVGLPIKQDLTMHQRESRKHPLTLLDQHGGPLKLDGCTISFRAHQQYKQANSDLIKQAEIVDAGNGEALIEFLPEDTQWRKGLYGYKIWVIDSFGNESPVTEGKLIID